VMFVEVKSQKVRLFATRANSAKAQCTGKPSYFTPISQSVQKPIEGRSLLQKKRLKTMLKHASIGAY